MTSWTFIIYMERRVLEIKEEEREREKYEEKSFGSYLHIFTHKKKQQKGCRFYSI